MNDDSKNENAENIENHESENSESKNIESGNIESENSSAETVPADAERENIKSVMFGIDDVAEKRGELPPETDGTEEDIEPDFDSESFEERYWRRIEEEKQKKRAFIVKTGVIALCVSLAALLVLIFIFTDTGAIGAYKDNFMINYKRLFPETDRQVDIGATHNDTGEQGYIEPGGAEIRTVERTAENVTTVSFDGAADAEFEKYGGGLVCARTNYICFINSKGETEWETATSVVDPLLSVDGKYIAIGSEGGTRLCLFDGSELLYETDTSDKIRSVSVSSGGDTVITGDRENYKGGVAVYNKSGQEIFSWSSGQNTVADADISSASRRVAAALVNADRQVYSIIRVFDINNAESSEMAFEDTLIFRVDYTGDTVTGFGDNSLVCMTSTGRVINDRRFDIIDITGVSGDGEGNKLISVDSAGTPALQVYGRKGVLEHEIITSAQPDKTDINGNYILYSSGRSVMLRRAGSDRVNEYTATMDILELKLISGSSYAVIHSNSIEFVTI
ncbi:MAG TPA: hypothetical protein IAA60_00630 [Candidatus Ornithomonoglobus intestinigallinarum]|uniref:Uncharacterized protein n=1 Tax=Candidatus Ornithomonoglobus intestinigallinarum TaxID=2840894 RepID=A0A9D1KP08_9FIRM|nr:hypothetical protein [Candidatus Ornithomonoglobus intestinigallinarum]